MSKSTNKPDTAAPARDPAAGGRYKRQPDGGLQQVGKTEQPTGRTPESQAALAQRLAAPAQPSKE